MKLRYTLIVGYILMGLNPVFSGFFEDAQNAEKNMDHFKAIELYQKALKQKDQSNRQMILYRLDKIVVAITNESIPNPHRSYEDQQKHEADLIEKLKLLGVESSQGHWGGVEYSHQFFKELKKDKSINIWRNNIRM